MTICRSELVQAMLVSIRAAHRFPGLQPESEAGLHELKTTLGFLPRDL